MVFSYIFLLFDCFKWVLIDCIEKCRVHSVLWQFHMGGSICLWYLHVFSMQWYFLIFSYYLTVLNGYSLTALKSEEFTLISGSFKWGRGDHHQFSLYLPISWLFQMSSHWLHSKVKSLLWALAVSNGGGIIVSFTQVNLTIWAHFALASRADLPGRAENLRNVNCSCCGSVVLGGVYHKIYLVSYWHCLISSY